MAKSKQTVFRITACAIALLGVLLVTQATEYPTIYSVSPARGVTTPGLKVTVSGSGFPPGVAVYFDGILARETKFVSSSQLEVQTPYLRPGDHLLQISSGAVSWRSAVGFSALPAPIDSKIDRAMASARQGQVDDAVMILEQIGQTDRDYQVRSAAYYAQSEIFFDHGDLVNWRRSSALIYLDSAKLGRSVQTFWGYRLAVARSHYLLDAEPRPGFDEKSADQIIELDVTQNAEPYFYRALLNVRSGNLAQAKSDSDFVARAWPNKTVSAVLAAYIAALGGDATALRSIASGPVPTDLASLSLLGEGLYTIGDSDNARRIWSAAETVNPGSAEIAFLAAKKHLANGQKLVAKALFTECTVIAPDSKEAEDSRATLSGLEE